MKLAVSYLSSNRSPEDTILKINMTRADYIHADLMDGRYVSEKNIDRDTWKALRLCKKPIEVHLMVKNPVKYVKHLAGLNIRVVYIHYSKRFLKNLAYIQKCGYRIGLVINPDDDLKLISEYFQYVDKVLVMSVVPGRGGQKFIQETIGRLKKINKYKLDNNLVFSVEVDGGINEETMIKISRYADTVVSGSYICKSDNYDAQVNKLKKIKRTIAK